ncbi:MAG: peptidoglycan bridge formation glycyltransferase FemA/FemB family protein [Bacilli bacterium]
MKIIELTKKEFDNYAIIHPNRSFYQTSSYGDLISKHGFKAVYIGLIDDNQTIKAASLILYRKIFFHYKFAYAPRGFLIDFNDYKLLKTFTKKLKKFLRFKSFVFLKIDPPIIYQKRNQDGNIENDNNQHVIEYLKDIGYVHLGFNNAFEALKPRWNIITEVKNSSDDLFNAFDKELKTKIRSAAKKGINITKGSIEDIKTFYNFVKKKHHLRGLNYYEDFWNIFHDKNMFELWFAKIDFNQYLKYAREIYDEEADNNSQINEELTTNKANRLNLINKKICSDNLLNEYKNNVILGIKMTSKYPEGKIIAGSAIIKYGNEIFFLIDGYDNKYKSFNPNHYLKWRTMEYYISKGYSIMHLNGISGNFEKENNRYYGLYNFKKAFNGKIIEYIGEFDLLIKKQRYYFFKRLYLLRNKFKLNK